MIGPVFLLLGLSTEEAGNVSLLLNLETTATVFLGWLVFKEQTNARLWVASALIVLGGVLLNIPFELGSFQASGWVFLACLSWGLDNHLTAEIRDYSAFQITCIKGLIAGGVNLCLAACVGTLAIIRMVRCGAHSWSHHLWWISRLVCRGSTAYRGQPFTNDLCQRPLLGCPLRMVWLGRKPHRISRDGHDLDGRCHMDRFQGRTK